MDFPKQSIWRNRGNIANQQAQRPKTPLRVQRPVFKGLVRIDGYEYDQENVLGQGYSSKVYLGRGVQQHYRQFAIKVVDKRRLSESIHHLLKQEIEVHRQLNHPNIVKCHDVIERGNFYYFVLEYCPHGTLETFIKKHNRLAQSTAVSVMQQILAAYKYLIQKKVLHRDLKPPNILRAGNTWKIGDFGFSLIGKKIFTGDVNVGTPAYMAPQCLERTFYSHKTDIFSLGIICYEMLFGVTPWQHKNQKILLKLMQQQPIPEDQMASLKNQNIATFIVKSCNPFEKKRMTPEQIESFSFRSENQLPKQDLLSKILKKSSILLGDKSQLSTCCPSQTSIRSIGKADSRQATFKGNCMVIQRQIYFVRLLLSILQHSSQLLISDPDQKELLFTVLSKHAHYLIRRIKHSRVNYLGLKKYEQFVAGEQFIGYSDEATNLAKKIDLLVVKTIPKRTINMIRQINKSFQDLAWDKNLTQKCVNNLKQYIKELLNSCFQEYCQRQGPKVSLIRRRIIQSLISYFQYIKDLTISSQQSRTIAVKKDYMSFGTLLQEQKPRTLSKLAEQIQVLSS